MVSALNAKIQTAKNVHNQFLSVKHVMIPLALQFCQKMEPVNTATKQMDGKFQAKTANVITISTHLTKISAKHVTNFFLGAINVN